MKTCVNCGYQAKDDAHFCKNCGNSFVLNPYVNLNRLSNGHKGLVQVSSSKQSRKKEWFLVIGFLLGMLTLGIALVACLQVKSNQITEELLQIDWLANYDKEGIPYTFVPADKLYANPDLFIGKRVVTSLVISKITDDKKQEKTRNKTINSFTENNLTENESIIASFDIPNELGLLKPPYQEPVIVTGIVSKYYESYEEIIREWIVERDYKDNEKLKKRLNDGIESMLYLSDCHIITKGVSLAQIEETRSG